MHEHPGTLEELTYSAFLREDRERRGGRERETTREREAGLARMKGRGGAWSVGSGGARVEREEGR